MKYFDYIVEEFKAVMRDEGVLLFFVLLPIAYPLIYSWIYNNEVARQVPVAVVDDSHSAYSRQFITMMDATPDVTIAYYCRNMQQAKDHIGHGEAYGILYFPHDFANKLGRHEQAHVGVYCDMSYMLTYKAIYAKAMEISMDINADIQKQMLSKFTQEEELVSVKPLEYEEVPIFNVTGGYGNFILPGVLVLIIQQAMLLGVGMIAGTRREERKRLGLPPNPPLSFAAIFGRMTTYVLIFSVMLAWITLVVPRIFGFVSMVHGLDLLLFFTPYLFACAFFAMCVSEMVRYRESVMLVVVFTSLPILFMSGISWPQTAIPSFWQGVSCIFPSTFAVRGFVRMSSMGALLSDCLTEYLALFLQLTIYFLIVVIINKVVRRAE